MPVRYFCGVGVGRERADQDHTGRHAQFRCFSWFFLISGFLGFSHVVDDDYLLENYFYAVVWRASWIKRVLRDYDYLDYSVLGWWLQTILSGMHSTGGGKSNRKAGLSEALRLFLSGLPLQPWAPQVE